RSCHDSTRITAPQVDTAHLSPLPPLRGRVAEAAVECGTERTGRAIARGQGDFRDAELGSLQHAPRLVHAQRIAEFMDGGAVEQKEPTAQLVAIEPEPAGELMDGGRLGERDAQELSNLRKLPPVALRHALPLRRTGFALQPVENRAK